MTKVIAYSLFRNHQRYCLCLLTILDVLKELYPDWEVWVYVADDVEKDVITALEQKHCRLIQYAALPGCQGTLQRFRAFWEPGIDYVLIRDADDILGYTDKLCVDMWVASDCQLYTLHAAANHCAPIMASLFGLVGNWDKDKVQFPDMTAMGKHYGVDEEWLAQHLLPVVEHSWLRLRLKNSLLGLAPEQPGMRDIEYVMPPKHSILHRLDLSAGSYDNFLCPLSVARLT